MPPPLLRPPLPPVLTPPEFAVVRCWAEGLDLVSAWRRYLAPDATDPRQIRARFQQMLERLRRLARSHDRADIDTLLRRDPAAIVDRGPRVPTLAEFAAGQPADFYSEAELIELHQERYGRLDARSSGRRRQRLRERLVVAVQSLERLGAPAPLPADPLGRWLDGRVAARLGTVGIRTIGELVFWIRTRGFHWHRHVPRLGPLGAARIVGWIAEHAATLGTLPITSVAPRRLIDTEALTPPPAIGIVPLERQRCPDGLDGRDGGNRAPRERCRLVAATDHEAVLAWLARRESGSHTWRAYRKEAERLLLWATLLRRKALSSLEAVDCAAYVEFLGAPGPEWLGARQTPRHGADWRPFEGPLSPRSRDLAVAVLRALFGWLVQQRYLLVDPWVERPAPRAVPAAPAGRALSGSEWERVDTWLQAEIGREATPPQLRLQALLQLAVGSGLRLSELAAARIGALQPARLDEASVVWTLRVEGGSPREVPLPPAAIDAVRRYLDVRGHRFASDDQPPREPAAPLLSHLDGERPLSPGRLYRLLRVAFGRCAAAVADHDRPAADRIRGASSQWLRHTWGLRAAERALPADLIQATLGHRHPGQAGAYVAAARVRRLEAFRSAFGASAPGQPASSSRRTSSTSSASAASLSAPAEKRSSS